MNRHRREPQRGLTLLEVLIATAILAVLAGAVVPSIAHALAALRPAETSSPVDRADLAAVADRFMAAPELFEKGLSGKSLHAIMTKQIAWPAGNIDDDERFGGVAQFPIQIRSLRSAGAGGGGETSGDGASEGMDVGEHLWLEFSCEGMVVRRWVTIPPKVKGRTERGAQQS